MLSVGYYATIIIIILILYHAISLPLTATYTMDSLLTQSEVRIPGKKRVLLDSQDEPMDQVYMGKRYKVRSTILL